MTCRLCRIIAVCLMAAVLIYAGIGTASAGVTIGDADGDGVVTIIDATCIQRNLAGLHVSSGFSKAAADVDGSGDIEITDATYIQRWLADLVTPCPIGTVIDVPTEALTEKPTEPPTEVITEPPTQWQTDDEGWIVDIFRP